MVMRVDKEQFSDSETPRIYLDRRRWILLSASNKYSWLCQRANCKKDWNKSRSGKMYKVQYL